MTAEQIPKEIEALPEAERQRVLERMREATSTNIPEDFIDALEDFDKGRFVSMHTALNETPPEARAISVAQREQNTRFYSAAIEALDVGPHKIYRQ